MQGYRSSSVRDTPKHLDMTEFLGSGKPIFKKISTSPRHRYERNGSYKKPTRSPLSFIPKKLPPLKLSRTPLTNKPLQRLYKEITKKY